MYILNKGIWKREGTVWNNTDINWLEYLHEYVDQYPWKTDAYGVEQRDISIQNALNIKLRMKPPKELAILPHVIGGDPAQTGDSFGLAMGAFIDFPMFKSQADKERLLYIDGLWEFRPDAALQKLVAKKKERICTNRPAKLNLIYLN